MDMKNMMLPKEPVNIMAGEEMEEGPQYPRGLCLCLDSITLKKLGMEKLPPIGAKLHVVANAEVKTVSERKEGDELKQYVELQIVEMAIGGDKKSVGEVFYG